MSNFCIKKGVITLSWLCCFGLFIFLFSCDDRSHKIKLSKGVQKEIYSDMIGLNGNLTALDNPWNNDSLVKGVELLGTANFRYPAGSLGNYWDWDKGWLDSEVPDSLMIKWVYQQGLTKSKNTYTLENFALGQKKLGFTPVFMINMLSKGLDHAVRNLLRAKELGLPVKYIELGNELYFNLPFEMSVYPTPEDYGKTCKIWIDSLKTHFPDAKYAIIGSYLERRERHTDWTRRAIKYCDNADAITFHKYSPAGIDGKQETKSITAGTEGKSDLRTAIRKTTSTDPVKIQEWEMSLLKNDTAYANYLYTAVHAAHFYEKINAPKDKEIWATEFNMRDDKSPLRGTWSNTLYIAKYYEEFIKGPVKITNIHNVTGNLFKQIFTGQNQLDHVLWKQIKSTPWKLSASGIATGIFARASRGMNTVSILDFSDARVLVDDRGNSCSTLAGWLFESKDSKKILLINYGRNSTSLDFSDFNGFNKIYEYSSDLENYITSGFKDVVISEKTIDSEIVLAPFSFTIIE